jgi:hypothetical protein
LKYRIIVLALWSPALLADTLQLESGIISSGGGAASSYRYSVSGTIGIPIADSEESRPIDGYVTRAGFWSQVVRWINVQPTAFPDTVERRAGQGIQVLASQLIANDVDPDWDPIQLVSVDPLSARGGSITREGQTITYSAPAVGDPLAEDTFTYRISDGVGPAVVGTVLVRVAGSPVISASPLQITILAGAPARVEIRSQAIAGRSYVMESSATVSGPWSNTGTLIGNASGLLTFIEPLGTQPRFYRLLEP